MQMNDLGTYLKINIDSAILDKEYYPYFQKFSSKRFAEIVCWVKEHYTFFNGYPRFPIISDFRKAAQATTIIDTFKPVNKRSNHIPYTLQPIVDGLKALGTVEKQLIGDKYNQLSKKQRMKTFIPFIREKMKNHEIYNTKAKKWGKHDQQKSMEDKFYFDPRDLYPENCYK